MIQVKKDSFKKTVMDFKGVTVVDFYADWCGPCKMLSPLMEEMSKENRDKNVQFVKINVDEESELAGMFGVMSIPTVVFFKDGKIVTQKIGVSSKEDYLALVETSKNGPAAKKASGDEVIIFTTPTCPYCHMAKDYMKQKNIKFREVDVSSDREWAIKMVKRSGQMGVPQLWIGDQTVVGYNPTQIDMLTGK
ncbi:MAG: thioredoxin [Patescibacteria group bacterium]